MPIMGDTLMKRLLLCLLFVLGLSLAGCEEFEEHEHHHHHIQLADQTQQIEVTVAQ